LIPVCPNCHAMLHRKLNDKEPTIEELKAMISK
jgi:5-methylcytosine-specific restriction protein A